MIDNASIILIGCPGAGKRSLGFIGAKHLGRRLILADRYFQTQTGVSRAEYLKIHGNAALQTFTVTVMRKMLEEYSTGCIIECGLGSLVTGVRQLLLREYKDTHPIIHINRCLRYVEKYLGLSSENHGMGFLRDCDVAHRECSNLEYYNLFDQSSRDDSTLTQDSEQPPPSKAPFFLKNAKQEFSSFLDLVISRPSHHVKSDAIQGDDFYESSSIDLFPLECRDRSYLRSVRLSGLVNKTIEVHDLASGEDGILLIVDILAPDILTLVSEYISIIRRAVKIPIVYTVERDGSERFGGKGVDYYFTLLHHGLRFCVEYTIVDINSETTKIQKLIQTKLPATKIIGSYFDPHPGERGWMQEDRKTKYQLGKSIGCHIVQLRQPAITQADNEDVQYFSRLIREQPGANNPFLIAYNVGVRGRTSQLANRIMTPVKHGTILNDTKVTFDNDRPFDPQITLRNAIQGLFANFIFDPLEFYLIGRQPSVSLIPPAMHRVAYGYCGFSHTFKIVQVSSCEDINKIAQSPKFGGASIMIPFKTLILNQLDQISPQAAAIGAINTLLPLRRATADSSGGIVPLPFALQPENRNHAGPVVKLFGDNTDWLGIQSVIVRNLSPRNAIDPVRSVALIIGAGGGARAAIYALIRLGCRKIYVYNRTVERAEKVARHFNTLYPEKGTIIRILPSLTTPWPENEEPATIIISAIPAHSLGGICSPPNFTLPEGWLQSKTGGVVAEVCLSLSFVVGHV
ncbi:Quinate repressor protein [Talaromyces pinophilus]|nr:Quinate repressor protein [Talaromyces pinophilus]